MLASFLLSLREGFEAALIIGIVLGAVRKLHRPDLSATVWAGALSALGVSALAGLGLYAVGFELEGHSEQVFEGLTMLLAAGVLTWMIFWMSRQSRRVKGDRDVNPSRFDWPLPDTHAPRPGRHGVRVSRAQPR